MKLQLSDLQLLILTALISLTLGDKAWIPNTNFNNPSNWALGRVPCSKDSVVFDADASVMVSLTSQSPLKELILPLNGEFLLGNGKSLEFGTNPDDTCEGGENKFIKTEYAEWYNPFNWLCDVDKQRESYRSPVPEAFRVPCKNDPVKFPEENSYKVSLNGPAVRMGSMELGGKSFTEQQFSEYLTTPEGILQFKKATDVNILKPGCDDEKGCACGNDELDYLPYICDKTGSACPQTDCSEAIKPKGSCCEFCGSFMIVVPSNDFKYSKLETLVQTQQTSQEYSTVKYHIVKLSDGNIQVTAVDVNEQHKVAGKFNQMVKREITSDPQYGVSKVELHESGDYKDPTGTGLSGGLIAFIVILVLIIISLVIFGFVKKWHHRIPVMASSVREMVTPSASGTSLSAMKAKVSKTFQKDNEEDSRYARFDVKKGEVSLPQAENELQFTSIAHSSSAPEQESSSLGFDNPMFSRMEKDPKTEAPPTVEKLRSRVGWTNPMYGKVENDDLEALTEKEVTSKAKVEEEPEKPGIIEKLKSDLGIGVEYARIDDTEDIEVEEKATKERKEDDIKTEISVQESDPGRNETNQDDTIIIPM